MSFERNRWINLWSAGALSLFVVYICVLYLAATPMISNEYRAYYVDRTTDLSVWQVKARESALAGRFPLLKQLNSGEIYPFSSERLLLTGWSDPEKEHIWSSGTQADIIFALPASLEQAAIERSFEAILSGWFVDENQIVGVTVNDIPIGRRIYRKGEAIIVPLPSARLDARVAHIALEFPNARSPGWRDSRILGFALTGVIVRERAFTTNTGIN